MSKTRKWPIRVLYFAIAVVMALGLMLPAASSVSADESEWSKVSTPSEEDWVLAPGFSISGIGLGASSGGMVYYVTGYNSVAGYNDVGAQLLVSKDGGATWKSLTDNVLKVDELEDFDPEDVTFDRVSVASDDSDFLIVVVKDKVTKDLYVVGSTDGGAHFDYTGDLEDGGVILNYIATSAISKDIGGGNHMIALGGCSDADESLYGTTPQMSGDEIGLVFRMESGAAFSANWEDATAYDGWQDCAYVSKVSFAPSFLTDDTVLALTHTADKKTYLQTGVWDTKNRWNEEADRGAAVLITSVAYAGVTPGTGLAIPSDYTKNDRVLWVYVNVSDVGLVMKEAASGKAGSVIFRVADDEVRTDLKQIPGNPLLASIAYSGTIDSGKAMVGLSGDGKGNPAVCCDGVQVYRNDTISDMDICCEPWDKACKPPTGRHSAQVMFVGATKAVCVVAGDGAYEESAFSVSYDIGDTWNQVGLVNTQIDNLSDVAKSPNCNKTWLVSINEESGCGCDSLWLNADPLPEATEYSGKWTRVWCGQLTNDYGLIRLAPEETEESLTVYLVDRGTDKLYYNETEGWACWEDATSTIDDIVDLAVESASTIYALGSDGYISKSINNGDDWEIADEESIDSDVDDGWTIAVFGTGEDAKVLVGGTAGKVSYSADAGETFSKLDDIGDGYVTVAFDSYFDTNSTIYAAVTEEADGMTGDGGVYRWVIDESEEWKDLHAEPVWECQDEELQVYGYTGLVLDRPNPGNPMTSAATGGVLYASFVGVNEDGDLVTGVARCLNPAEEVCCGQNAWDFLVAGLTPGEEAFYFMPKALKICGCLTADSNTRLWAIDGLYGDNGPGYDMEKGNDGTVWTYEDCLSKAAPELKGVADGAMVAADPCTCFNDNFTLSWERLCNACEYDVQIALDEEFTEIVMDTEDFISGDYASLKGPGCFYEPPEPATPSLVVKNGTLDCTTTFYWRVRVHYTETDETICSPWSEVWSFTVGAPTEQSPAVTGPEAGATGVAVKNVGFTWEAVPGADSYTFVLDDNSDLSSPIVTQTGLTTTAYNYAGPLDYETTYYWQVKAMMGDQVLSQGSVSSFTTAAKAQYCCPTCGLCFDTQAELEAHAADAHPLVPPTPTWVWVVIGLGAVLVIVVVVLIFRTRRV